MERLPHKHLNLYELTLLVPDRTFQGTQLDISDGNRKELEDHLLSCQSCRELLEQEQLLFHLSMRRQSKELFRAGTDCVSEEQWMEIVAGQRTPEETQRQLEHALDCARCAALLKRFAEQFADETTPEERERIEGLASAHPDWQKDLARQMHQQNFPEQPHQTEKKTWYKPGFLARFVLTAGSAAILLCLAWWFAYGRSDRTVNRLLSEAYSTQRTMDLRMHGAGYAPVEVFRGGAASEPQPSTALLEAEILITKQLRARPDDPFWLDARGRAELMNDRHASAVGLLERAHRYAPEDQSIRIDLATAYFLRAEELKRSEDYGRAADLLGLVLAADPRNGIARFNRAIVSERLHLYQQAIGDWKLYIDLDPQSPWSDEARKHLKDIQGLIDLHRPGRDALLADPAEFVTLALDVRPTSREEREARADRYFELALREWVPLAFSNRAGSERGSAQNALNDLAKILVSEHGDFWWTDFLRELNEKPRSRNALLHLVDALKYNQLADYDRARASAVAAENAFRGERVPAGELISRFESSYAAQLSHQVSHCLAEARVRGDPPSIEKYPWLRAQLDLEMAVCIDWNDEDAPKFASEALSLAKLHHYPSLELRATTFLAGLSEDHGDTSSAWRYTSQGLARYWEGGYSPTRGYNLYAGLDFIAEDQDEWSLDVQVLEEAAVFIRDNPDLEVRGLAYYRLANALAMTGDYSSAKRNFEQGQALFSQSFSGPRKNNLQFEAQIGLARIELLRSLPGRAIERLEPLKATAEQFEDRNLAFDYFRNLGLAYFTAGDLIQARRNLTTAVTLAERSLRTNGDERERLIWCRKSDEVYRAMVQLSSLRSPGDAFPAWEWFKGASLRGSASDHALPSPEGISFNPAIAPRLSFLVPDDTVVLSFAFLPQGAVAWTYSHDSAIQEHPLGLSSPDLERLARKFRDHCSHPDSDMQTLHREGQELYQQLIRPMEASLRPYKHLVIEPDQSLWMIPFEALLDRDGVYLGDRYAISISPGLDYLSLTPSSPVINQQSRIVVVGDPEIAGSAPLDDARGEAKGIAEQFRYSTLLLNRDAGYARVVEQIENADIFHFSGHATASPDGVGLVLGDSVMDVSTIRASKFSHLKLAVLSACDSANGATATFDDRDSVARLLVGSGVPDVVASRWLANSRATASLMREFYGQLLLGKGVSAALAEARRKLRGRDEFLHPFYWANFSAFGKT